MTETIGMKFNIARLMAKMVKGIE